MKKSIDIKGAIESREDLEKCMGEFAQARLALEGAKLEKEARLKEAREEFEAVEPALKAAVEAPFKQLELWARMHPDAFDGKRSLELVQGTIGFRTGQPRVALPRGCDEAALCLELQAAGLGRFVRTVPVLDREEVIRAARSDAPEDSAWPARLSKEFGIRVSQAERFFAEERRDKADGTSAIRTGGAE